MEIDLGNMMKLSNPFPQSVRLLYLGHWECFKCGSNGTNRGGLEIHHILGRVSGSAFNSSCLCHYCHTSILHNRETHRFLFGKLLRFLYNIRYKPIQDDFIFLRNNYNDLVSEKSEQWLKEL